MNKLIFKALILGSIIATLNTSCFCINSKEIKKKSLSLAPGLTIDPKNGQIIHKHELIKRLKQRIKEQIAIEALANLKLKEIDTVIALTSLK